MIWEQNFKGVANYNVVWVVSVLLLRSKVYRSCISLRIREGNKMPQTVDVRPVFQYITKTIYIVIYSYLCQVAADSLHASSFLLHILIIVAMVSRIPSASLFTTVLCPIQ